MWLVSSSIGRKVVMSVSGSALVLFLTFHMLMNLVYVYDVAFPAADGTHYYDKVCEFLGTNWYALIATAGLAFLVLVHLVYAFILTAQNRKARGDQRYAVSGKQPVHWAAKNMLVLGVIIILGMLLHLKDFWYNMMFAELAGEVHNNIEPTKGYEWINLVFACPVTVCIYAVWFCAIWYHLTHGIWSSMQTLGLNGKVWLDRWICISYVWATVIVLGFASVVVAAIINNGGFVGC